MKAVAAGNEVAPQLLPFAGIHILDGRVTGPDLAQAGGRRFKIQRQPGGNACIDQVANDFVLSINGDRPPVRRGGHIEAVTPAVEGHVNTFMAEPLPLQPLSQPDLVHEIDRTLLEHAGAHPLDHIRLAPGLDDDRVDPLTAQ